MASATVPGELADFRQQCAYSRPRSGVPHDLGQPFESAERDLRLALTRLTGAEDDAYYEVRGLGERFVRAAAGSLAVVCPA